MQRVLTGNHRANRLLAALEPDDFVFLEPHLKVVTLPKAKVLYEAGEVIRHVSFPHDSMVCLINLMEEGRAVEVASFGREGMFGLLSALVSREAFGRYIVQIPGTASQIAVERVQDAFSARPEIRRLLLRYTEALLAQTFQTVSCNAVHSVESRCCNWILSTRDRVDHDTLPLTHEFLSEMLGVQRSTVSVVLRSLQKAGLIMQQRGGIQITDREGLEEVACECYGKIRQSYAKLLPNTFRPS